MPLLRSIFNFFSGRFCCYGIQLDTPFYYNHQHERQAASHRTVKKDRSSNSSVKINNNQNGGNQQPSLNMGVLKERNNDRNVHHSSDLISTHPSRRSRIGMQDNQIPSTSRIQTETTHDPLQPVRYQQVDLVANPALNSGTSRDKDSDINLHHSVDSTSTGTQSSGARTQGHQVSSISVIKDTSDPFQPPRYLQNQANVLVNPAQKPDPVYGNQLQQQANPSTLYQFETGYRDPPTRTVQEEDLVTRLKKNWDKEMQIENFIRSKMTNFSQPYRDLCNEIVRNCHQTIENHLKPQWSTTLTRYTQMMAQRRRNKYNFDSANNKEVRERRLEIETLTSRLQVYTVEKICFDKAISSCFSEIVNEYKNGHDDEDIDLNNNQTIQDIMGKINLEIKRLCIGLPIYSYRYKIQQQVNSNQIIIIKGQTGMYNRLVFLLSRSTDQ